MVPTKAIMISHRMALIIQESACSRIVLNIDLSQFRLKEGIHTIKRASESQAIIQAIINEWLAKLVENHLFFVAACGFTMAGLATMWRNLSCISNAPLL